jgi:hypothetical protein
MRQITGTQARSSVRDCLGYGNLTAKFFNALIHALHLNAITGLAVKMNVTELRLREREMKICRPELWRRST